MQRMLDENEEAMTNALKADLHRSKFGATAAETWDVVGQVRVRQSCGFLQHYGNKMYHFVDHYIHHGRAYSISPRGPVEDRSHETANVGQLYARS